MKITPNFSHFSSLDKYLNPNNSNEDLFGFFNNVQSIDIDEEIKKSKITLVLGEPGFGKSTYLDELSKNHKEISGDIIDCKEVYNLGIEKFLDILKDKHQSKAKFLYLDSLDEVDLTMIKSILKNTKEIISMIDINLIIACRNHYIFDLKPQLLQLPIKNIIQIKEFNNSQIINYINHKFNDQNITQYFTELLNTESFKILKTPRYLKAFIETYEDDIKSKNKDLTISRVDLFEKVIYHKLVTEQDKETDKSKININEISLSKRILEKLALIFEIYQKNQITMDELLSFLDEIDSNISTIFLNSNNLDRFIQRTLKTTNNIISFDNTEFTEYLAAKELIRIGNTSQVIYDLILNKDLNIIYPNWYNVLAFAIEIDAQKVLPILSTYLENTDHTNIDKQLIYTLLHVNIRNYTPSINNNIFASVFNYYQNSKQSIHNYTEYIVGYYTDNNGELIKVGNIDNGYETSQQLNKALIIRSLAIRKKLTEPLKSEWIEHIKKIEIKSINKKNYLSNYLWILESLISPQEFRDHISIINIQNKELAEIIIESYNRYESGIFTEDFLELILQFPEIDNKDRYLASLKDLESIKKVFEYLLIDIDKRKSFFNKDYSIVDFSSLFKTIYNYKKELKNKVEAILFSYIEDDDYPYFDGAKQLFLGECVKFLIKNRSFDDLLAHSKFERIIIYNFHNYIAESINVSQYNKIKNFINSKSTYSFELNRLNSYIKLNNVKLANQLSKTDVEFKKNINENSKLIIKQQEDNESEVFIKNFQFKIENTPSITDDIFNEFLKRKDLYRIKLDPNHLEKLKTAVSHIINSIDPNLFRIINTPKSSTYSEVYVENDVFFKLNYYIKIANELELSELIIENRSKIIKYIPLLHDTEQTKFIFDFLGNIDSNEQEELYRFCISRKDSLSLYESNNFCEIISKNKWHIFKPYLIEIFNNSTTRDNIKFKVLNAFGELSTTDDDKKFLLQLEDSNYTKNYIGNIANQFLISNFHNLNSIEKRFEYFITNIKQKKFNPNQLSDYWYGQTPYFNCVHDICDNKTEEKILTLLEESLRLDITSENSERINILQNEVMKYYELNISFQSLSKIKSILNIPLYTNAKFTFNENLKILKFILLNNNVSCRSISESIQNYNEVKKRKYLPIYDVNDLKSKIDESIIDFKSFFFDEAYSNVISKILKNQNIKSTLFVEDTLQKTLKIAMENALLNKGIRNTDIVRELQIFDNKRLDLVVKYGFIGPIIFELKLLNNPEIQIQKKRLEYKDKLLQYIKSVKSQFSYYLVFNVNPKFRNQHLVEFNNLVLEYEDIKNLKIELINCV